MWRQCLNCEKSDGTKCTGPGEGGGANQTKFEVAERGSGFGS